MLPLRHLQREEVKSKIYAEQQEDKIIFVLDKEKQEAERNRVQAQKEIALSPNTKIIMMGGGRNSVVLGGN